MKIGKVHARRANVGSSRLGGLQTLLTKRRERLTLTNVLAVKLLANIAKLRASAKGLRILLLTKGSKLRACSHSLLILLLAKIGSLLRRLLLGRTVGLCRTEANALLLLRRSLRLSITRLKKV